METACSSSGTNGKRRRRNKKGCYKPRSDQGGKCSKPPSEPKEDNLKVTKEVLKSETALLALYDKWFLKVKPAQSEEAKKKRFQYFKDSCELVVKLNQEHPGGMFGLTSMANYSPQEGFGLDPNSDDEEDYNVCSNSSSTALCYVFDLL